MNSNTIVITTVPYGYIYKLTNKINGKMYIGQTTDALRREEDYKNLKCKSQPKIYNALRKYGIGSFTFELIDNAVDRYSLNDLEVKYIKDFNTVVEGYNCRAGGEGGKHTEVTKKLMSKIHMGKKGTQTGKKLTEEHKRKISEAAKGRRWSDVDKKRISTTKKSQYRKMTQDQKDYLSKKLSGAGNGNYGREFTEGHKRKIGLAGIGRVVTDETRRKISIGMLNKNRKRVDSCV